MGRDSFYKEISFKKRERKKRRLQKIFTKMSQGRSRIKNAKPYLTEI